MLEMCSYQTNCSYSGVWILKYVRVTSHSRMQQDCDLRGLWWPLGYVPRTCATSSHPGIKAIQPEPWNLDVFPYLEKASLQL